MTDAPEPGRQLYDAVRDLGLLASAWGPWDTLSCQMQGDLAREEYCLVREVGPPAVTETLPTAPTAGQRAHERWRRYVFDTRDPAQTWDALTDRDQANWEMIADHFPDEQPPAAAAEKPVAEEHQHEWDCAACRHNELILYCRHCPAIRKEQL